MILYIMTLVCVAVMLVVITLLNLTKGRRMREQPARKAHKTRLKNWYICDNVNCNIGTFNSSERFLAVCPECGKSTAYRMRRCLSCGDVYYDCKDSKYCAKCKKIN